MPLIRMLPLLALALSLHAASAVAVESLWQTPTATLPLSPQPATCSDKPSKPFTGDLQFKSKYNQSDASKSNLSLFPSISTYFDGKHIKEYLNELQRYSKRAEHAASPKQAQQALACLSIWLDSWAVAGALESRDASKTGIATRKWALAAMTSSVLRLQAVSRYPYRLSAPQQAWFSRLAEIVIDDHQPRRTAGFRHYNNHDYWAAWSVAATGMLTDREDYLQWAFEGLQPFFEQLVEVKNGDYAYLPAETARGKRASDYSHYAMVPLTLLVEAREHNGQPLTAREQALFLQFATFTARSAIEPTTLPELSKGQAAPARHKMIWLIPFLSRYPDHQWARRLYDQQQGDVDGYSQIGGHLKPLYPALKP